MVRVDGYKRRRKTSPLHPSSNVECNKLPGHNGVSFVPSKRQKVKMSDHQTRSSRTELTHQVQGLSEENERLRSRVRRLQMSQGQRKKELVPIRPRPGGMVQPVPRSTQQTSQQEGLKEHQDANRGRLDSIYVQSEQAQVRGVMEDLISKVESIALHQESSDHLDFQISFDSHLSSQIALMSSFRKKQVEEQTAFDQLETQIFHSNDTSETDMYVKQVEEENKQLRHQVQRRKKVSNEKKYLALKRSLETTRDRLSAAMYAKNEQERINRQLQDKIAEYERYSERHKVRRIDVASAEKENQI